MGTLEGAVARGAAAACQHQYRALHVCIATTGHAACLMNFLACLELAIAPALAGAVQKNVAPGCHVECAACHELAIDAYVLSCQMGVACSEDVAFELLITRGGEFQLGAVSVGWANQLAVQTDARCDGAALAVNNVLSTNFCVALRCNHAPRAGVFKLTRDLQIQVFQCIHHAAVIELGGIELAIACGADVAAQILQVCGLDFEQIAACMLDDAAVVGQAICRDVKAVAVAGDVAPGVVNGPRQCQGQWGWSGLFDAALAVAQVVCRNLQLGCTDCGLVCAQCLCSCQFQALTCHQGCRGGVDARVCGCASATPDNGQLRVQGDLLTSPLTSCGVNSRTMDLNVVKAGELAVELDVAVGVQPDRAAFDKCAVTLEAGCDQAAGCAVDGGFTVFALGFRLHLDSTLGCDGATVGDLSLCGDVGVFLAVKSAAVGEPAVVVEREWCACGLDQTCVVDAQASLRTNQHDFARVHAPQVCDIQCHAWCCRACVVDFGGGDHDFVVLCRNGVLAGGQLQLLGPDARVDLCRPREDAGVVCSEGIESLAVDADQALCDVVAVDAFVVEQWRARGQGDTAGIEEAATIDLDAGGVGNDDFGTLACYFNRAMQLAGVAAVDFVEDDLGTALGQPGVGLHSTAGIALGCGAAVVDDHAIGANIELAECVARHACAAGCLDVDLNRAIACLEDGGLLLAWRCGVRHNARARQLSGAWRFLCVGTLSGHAHQKDGPQCSPDCPLQAVDRSACDVCAGRLSPLACVGAGLAVATCAVAAGGFSHGHELTTAGVKNDAVGGTVHAVCSLEVGADGKACNVPGCLEVVGFLKRASCKDIELQGADLSAQADSAAGQVLVSHLGRTGAGHAAMVNSEVNFLPTLTQGGHKFIAPCPPALGAEHVQTVKAPDGVSAANAELVLGGKNGPVVLRTPAAVVGQFLRPQLKGRFNAGVCAENLHP